MAKIDLNTMSREELITLKSDVEKAITSYDARIKKEALAAAEAEAVKRGFTLTDLLAQSKPVKKKSAANPPKYRHPENPEQTWTGRGRQPGWIKEHLEAGQSLDELLIK